MGTGDVIRQLELDLAAAASAGARTTALRPNYENTAPAVEAPAAPAGPPALTTPPTSGYSNSGYYNSGSYRRGLFRWRR